MTTLLQHPHHAKLKLAKRLATLMDTAFTIPLTKKRIGLDPILGTMPVIGDGIGLIISLFIIYLALETGVPRKALRQMLVNVLLDAIVGAVPIIGDILDVYWKANIRNVRLMEQHFEAELGLLPAKPKGFARLFSWLPGFKKQVPALPGRLTLDVAAGSPQTSIS